MDSDMFYEIDNYDLRMFYDEMSMIVKGFLTFQRISWFKCLDRYFSYEQVYDIMVLKGAFQIWTYNEIGIFHYCFQSIWMMILYLLLGFTEHLEDFDMEVVLLVEIGSLEAISLS